MTIAFGILILFFQLIQWSAIKHLAEQQKQLTRALAGWAVGEGT
jgi:hypothetical protein